MATKTVTIPNFPKLGAFSQESLENLSQHLRGDPVLKRAAISSIRKNPGAFVENVFNLTRAQQLTLQTAVSREIATIIAETYILSLDNPKVTFSKTQNDGSPQVTLELKLTSTPISLNQQREDVRKGKPKKRKNPPDAEGGAWIRTRC